MTAALMRRVDLGRRHDEVGGEPGGEVDVLAGPAPAQRTRPCRRGPRPRAACWVSHHASKASPTAHPVVRRAASSEPQEPRSTCSSDVVMPAAEVRRRGAHGVADEQQARAARGAVGAGLAAVVVLQRAARQDVVIGRDRSGSVQSARPGMAGTAASNAASCRSGDEVAVVGGADDQHGEDAALVEEDDDQVAVAVGLPGDRVDQRAGLGAGRAAGTAGRRRRSRRRRRPSAAPAGPGDPARPAGGVDDEVGRQGCAVDDQPGGAPVRRSVTASTCPGSSVRPGWRAPRRAAPSRTSAPAAQPDAARSRPSGSRISTGSAPAASSRS